MSERAGSPVSERRANRRRTSTRRGCRLGRTARRTPERDRELRVHKGYEWLYVLSGRLRLILGEHEITMGPGEVAEFDTGLPHWFGPEGDDPVEVLSIHSSHGSRMQVRAAPRRTAEGA